MVDFEDENFLDNLDIEIEKQNNILSGNTSLNNTRYLDVKHKSKKLSHIKSKDIQDSRNS